MTNNDMNPRRIDCKSTATYCDDPNCCDQMPPEEGS
jgi:hypothetical protein